MVQPYMVSRCPLLRIDINDIGQALPENSDSSFAIDFLPRYGYTEVLGVKTSTQELEGHIQSPTPPLDSKPTKEGLPPMVLLLFQSSNAT